MSRIAKGREDKHELLSFAALAAARSIRAEESHPRSFATLASAHSLIERMDSVVEGEAEIANLALREALLATNRDICDPDRVAYSLPRYEEPPRGAKEEITYEFFEAVREGAPDAADLCFSWLVSDLDRDQATDLLLSSGLQGVTQDLHKVVSAVEALSVLQWLGWEFAPIVLRPVVRLQARQGSESAEYDRACREVADKQLLRLALRRPPGALALGEESPERFLDLALAWAQSGPEARMGLVSSSLSEGIPLEDIGEIVGVATTLLFLQEALRDRGRVWGGEDLESRCDLAIAGLSMRSLIRIGTPGQRVLGVILAGSLPGIRDTVLEPNAPDCGWWLPPVTKLLEPATDSVPAENSDQHGEGAESWRVALESRKVNGLLPILSSNFEKGKVAGSFKGALAVQSPAFDFRPELGIILERTFAAAYDSTRSPHRWLHLWASGVSCCLWPNKLGPEVDKEGLSVPQGIGKFSTRSGPEGP